MSSRYGVFLSFRGIDTRRIFVCHLYKSLTERGIVTFKDNLKIKTGEYFPQAIMEALQGSSFAIVVISQNFTSSKWCLIELQSIMELRRKNKLTVFPIFYGVDPSDMRNEKGRFLKTLNRHRRRPFVDAVPKWKDALNEISHVIGKDPRNFDDDDAMIKVIVRDITARLSSMVPMELEGLVGMNPHMERLDHRFNIESEDDDVRMIGIWGMGGIGKSTIAKYFFSRHSYRFSARCFMEDVGKLSRTFGLVGLQERLISYILSDEYIKLSTVEHGHHHIKSTLGHRRVLMVLDGVDTVDQIRALLVKETSIFGRGSRIIITTRNRRLLKTWGFMEGDLYEVNCLEKDDSLLMFKGFAFAGGIPPSYAHEQLSIEASQLAHALRAFGLCFREMTTIAEWKNHLGRLETTPPEKTTEIFEISYMSLSKIEKDVFLYVACLFNGDSVLRVGALFDDFAYVIQVLSDMSLINISIDGYLKMHVLVEQMGKQIVRQESRQRPQKQQILWDTRDICDVLQHQSGSSQIQCLALHVCEMNRKLAISSRDFNSMYRLKFLKLYKHSDDDIESKLQFDSGNHFYLRLSLLHWDAYPLKTLPFNLELESLVELNLRYSNLESLWDGKSVFRKLRRIDVTGSKNLRQFPYISRFTRLEELLMDCCSKLERFPDYSGSLYNLRKLHATHCDHLMSLEIRVSTRTEELSVTSWPRIVLEFPNEEELHSLTNLSIDGKITFCLEQLEGDADHFSFNSEKQISYKLMMGARAPFVPSLLHNFKYLEIKRSKYKEDDPPFKCHGFSDFPLLRELNLINLKINNIPSCIGELECLETLNLNGNDFKNLPETMEQLSNLKYLDLHNCRKLEALPTLTQVETLILSNCISLISLLKLHTLHQVDQGRYRLLELELDNCNNIQSLSHQLSHFTDLKELKLNRHNFVTVPKSIKELSSLTTLSLNNCNNLESLDELPLSLKYLYAHGCFKLETVSVSPDHSFEDIDLDHCFHLKLDDHLINQFPTNKCSEKVPPECGCSDIF